MDGARRHAGSRGVSVARTEHIEAPKWNARAPRSRADLFGMRAGPLVALLAGVVLAVTGAAQLYAGLLQARAMNALELIDWDDHPPTASALTPIIDDLGRADDWWPEPVDALTLGELQMRLAVLDGGTPAAASLKRAVLELKQSVSQGPASATAWAWLAYAYLLTGDKSAAVSDALSNSIKLARFEPVLLAMRCEIGLAIYGSLKPDRRAELADQIRLLARRSPRELVRVTKDTGKLAIVIQALLGGDNETLQRFQDAL